MLLKCNKLVTQDIIFDEHKHDETLEQLKLRHYVHRQAICSLINIIKNKLSTYSKQTT